MPCHLKPVFNKKSELEKGVIFDSCKRYINSEINENHFLRKSSVFNDIFQLIMQELDKTNRTQFNIHLHLPLGIIRKR